MKTLSFLKTLTFAMAWLLALGCSATQGTPTGNDPQENVSAVPYPSAESDLKVAKATVEAYEAGDWEKLRSLLSADARIFGLGNFDSLNVDQTINYWTQGREVATPVISEGGTWLPAHIRDGKDQGNWVLHWGTNTLSYGNGESITFPYHIKLKLENSKIVESHFYYDNMKIIRALGYAISPPLEENEAPDLDLEIEE